MACRPCPDGVTMVEFGGAVGLFASRLAAPAGLDNPGLAAAAGAACRALLGRDVAVLFGRQEHTALSFVFAAEPGRPLPPGGHDVGVCDALITAEEEVALLVRTADCLPVLLAGAGVIAAVHAGWKGLAADILGRVVNRIGNDFGVERGALSAVIGVGIGPCHFEAGNEVVAALAAHECDASGWAEGGFVDLAGWAAGRLRRLGLDAQCIQTLPGCTSCSSDLHSWRRDREAAGRQWNAVFLTPPR